MIEDPELQVNGFILIIDWSNFTFKQASKLTPSMLRLAIEGLQVRPSAVRRLRSCCYGWQVFGRTLMLESVVFIPRHQQCLFNHNCELTVFFFTHLLNLCHKLESLVWLHLSVLSVNVKSLGFGLLVGQNKRSKDITLVFYNIFLT